ncbi:glycosyltransferase family 90 protein [Xylariaceae sp. FL1272]|nr:glycosyltransferase family 90 protein [Xylariaceae sp. FL1272]
MARPKKTLDPITVPAGLALVCCALTQYLSTKQDELPSELICWILLPFIFALSRSQSPNVDHVSKALPQSDSAKSDPHAGAFRVSRWVVALGMTTYSVYKGKSDYLVLLPALTPLLLLSQRNIATEIIVCIGESRSWSLEGLLDTRLGPIFVAILGILGLSRFGMLELAWSIIPLFALYAAYAVLHGSNDRKRSGGENADFEAPIRPLSLLVVGMLAIALEVESVLFGFSTTITYVTLGLGISKALTWYYVSKVARMTSWLFASLALTFGFLSTRNPFTEKSNNQALALVIASLITLAQIVTFISRNKRSTSYLWLLSAIPLVPYMANLTAIYVSHSSPVLHVENHPVEGLIKGARSSFGELLQKQSRTYEAAYEEYIHRYGTSPPSGFEDWYAFARAHYSPIIDDFDTIFSGISPLLYLSGQDVLDAMNEVYTQPNNELWRCKISQGTKLECTHEWRTNDRDIASFLDKLVEQLPANLPNVTLLVNHLDEPRVILPKQGSTAPTTVGDMSRQNIWDTLTRSCDGRIDTGNREPKTKVDTFGLPFISDPVSALNICSNSAYNETHGMAMSPTTFRPIDGLVPVLSAGAISTMGDILYPSPAYLLSEFMYDETKDISWEKKQNRLYWTGSTTGGYAKDETWASFQRQRFVALAQRLKKRAYSYLREENGVIRRVTSSFLNGRLYDVAFTRFTQCTSPLCRAQSSYFTQAPWVSKDEVYKSKLLFDIDGNGISGRFYRLLASNSVPFKQTIFREWHDERLAPWVHYIPVSVGLGELPELVHYLAETESGRLRAREIAEQGRQWHKTAFREVDFAVYWYRLLLELARLQDSDRPAWNRENGGLRDDT